MKQILKKHKNKLQTAGILTALVFAVVAFGNSPAVEDLEPFVLVAQESIHLSDSTQISSGDITSNKNIRVSQNAIVGGNLFSDRIQLADNTSINGDVTFNRLIKAQTAEVFGEETEGISKNVVELPQVPEFETGNESITVDENATIDPGSYDRIEVEENVTLTLNPGVYNLNRITLKPNSGLLYSGETIVNVGDRLRLREGVAVVSNDPNQESTTNLQFNYTGNSPAAIGKSAFVTAKILAPESRVHLEENTTYLGQIIAKDIQVGEGSVLSRETGFEKASDLNKVIELPSNVSVVSNEMIILFNPGSTLGDLMAIAELIDGKATGFIPEFDMGKIEVNTTTFSELEMLIETIINSNHPTVEDVVPNALAF